jgi:TetR/AcrR family transcriptional regulator, tetracycline repressor protein
MPRRSSNDPTGLSSEGILAAAVAIADTEGIEALSMRRLAQELDVWPMSVYRYYQDKDALLDAMAAYTAGRVGVPGKRAASWQTRMRALLTDAQRSIAASPGVADRLPRAIFTPPGARVSELGVTILLDAGLPPAEAARAWRSLWSYTFGFATFQVGPERATRSALSGLPEEDYPALAATGNEVAAAFTDDSEFERGLDVLLGGIAAKVETAAR